ncbi:MAG: glycosyltransferase [bacterium]|nr:glycosyltransferase [bacterium]
MTNRPNTPPELEIIILNYNTADLTGQLINKLKNHPPNWRITIIDNNSSASQQLKLKRLKQTHPQLNLIFNSSNLGFAAGNNVALRQTAAPYILLLNSDVLVTPSAIKKTLDFIKTKPKAAAVTLKLFLNSDKTKLDWACHRGFPTPWASLTYFLGLEKLFPFIPIFSRYHQKHLNLNSPHQVDAISGAFFLGHQQSLKSIGFFDEDYFMYGEDIDLCYRLKKLGLQIWFYPSAQAVHLKHRAGLKSQTQKTTSKTRTHFFTAMKTFYQKHYAPSYPSWLNRLVLTSIDLLARTPFKK